MTTTPVKPVAKMVPALDYMAAQTWINHCLGYDQCDAGTALQLQDAEPEHRVKGTFNYWHHALVNQFGENNVRNDSYVAYGPYSFVHHYQKCLAEYGWEDWRTIIAKVWADEFPDPPQDENAGEDSGYEIWMSW